MELFRFDNFQALFLMNLILRNSSRLRFASSTFVTFVDTSSSFPHLECDEIFDPLFVNASKASRAEPETNGISSPGKSYLDSNS